MENNQALADVYQPQAYQLILIGGVPWRHEPNGNWEDMSGRMIFASFGEKLTQAEILEAARV